MNIAHGLFATNHSYRVCGRRWIWTDSYITAVSSRVIVSIARLMYAYIHRLGHLCCVRQSAIAPQGNRSQSIEIFRYPQDLEERTTVQFHLYLS
ncbi:MAG: hypothetical protein ACAF41_22820 [Leptolyngbya sp. BL-A-14]